MTKITRRKALGLLGAAAASLAGFGHAGARAKDTMEKKPLLTRKIPSTGEALSIIGLGTWQTFDVGPGAAERAPMEDVLGAFSASGGRLVDSSPMYGRSEQVVGDLSARLGIRERLFVATKVWTTGREAGIRQMEDSLRKLRADPIDLMQVHNLMDAESHLATLAEWKRAGRLRYAGVTHYAAGSHAAVAETMAAHTLDFVQINYSLGEREAEERILPMAMDRGVAVIANRPFSGGSLFRRLRGRPLPAWASEIDCVSWAQILLKFVVSHPAVTCAIPATSKVAHLRDNMGAASGRMPDASLRARMVRELV